MSEEVKLPEGLEIPPETKDQPNSFISAIKGFFGNNDLVVGIKNKKVDANISITGENGFQLGIKKPKE